MLCFVGCPLKRWKGNVQIYSMLDLGQEAEPKSTCGGKKDPRGFPFVIAVLFVLTWNVHWVWDKELDSCCGKALLAGAQHASAFELFMQIECHWLRRFGGPWIPCRSSWCIVLGGGIWRFSSLQAERIESGSLGLRWVSALPGYWIKKEQCTHSVFQQFSDIRPSFIGVSSESLWASWNVPSIQYENSWV